MKLKKLVLALGAISAAATPLVAVVSCSTQHRNVNGMDMTDYNYGILPTYTGQADQLLSLGIAPDRYPYQLDKTAPFEYITDPGKYMIGQNNGFKEAFAKKISSLMPKDQGTGWWNQQALQDSDKGSDPEYWEHRSGVFTMYEHYLLDDGEKAIGESIAPKHIAGSHTFVQTNFRESRDPYTRLPRRIMYALLDKSEYDSTTDDIKGVVDQLLEVARAIEGYKTSKGKFTFDISKADPLHKSVDNKPMPSGVPQKDASHVSVKGVADASWLYNDYFFAKTYHEQFLDNDQFKASPAFDWMINQGSTADKWVFDKDPVADKQLAKLFFEATFTPSEAAIKKIAIDDYAKNTRVASHHPIYEQQTQIGSAPMFEGAQRDNMLYFYNTAAKISKAFTDPGPDATEEERNSYAALDYNFPEGTHIRTQLDNAESNAGKISTQLRQRMSYIKKLVTAVKAANGGHLSFGLITLAPGEGMTTLQSASKYSFLYNELGFDQAMPDNLKELSDHAAQNVPGAEKDKSKPAFFNMDDNGWWWNLGELSDVADNAAHFHKTLDMGLLSTNPLQFKNYKDSEKTAIDGMFKDGHVEKVEYNLWNEGLKTPYVLNMMLDKITDMLDKKSKESGSIVTINKNDLKNSKYWGDYWTKEFIK